MPKDEKEKEPEEVGTESKFADVGLRGFTVFDKDGKPLPRPEESPAEK